MKISKVLMIGVLDAVPFSVVEAQTFVQCRRSEIVTGSCGHTRQGRQRSHFGSPLPSPSGMCRQMIMLAAEFRAQDIGGGSKDYHGVHLDYEIRIGGKTSWSDDWSEEPTSEWKTVTRTWEFPINMERATIRIGLQGVNGRMEVRNIRISSC